MINLVIAHLVAELNAYLNLRSPRLNQDRAMSGSLFDTDGKSNSAAKDKLLVTLANVEEDRVYRSLETFQRRADGVGERVRPKTRVNLYLLFVANLDNYDEALKALSQVVAFFQHRGAFEVPGNGTEERARVVFDLYSMTFEQQNHLWAALGAKYMPSVMYRGGIVDVRDLQVEALVPPVEEISTEG